MNITEGVFQVQRVFYLPIQQVELLQDLLTPSMMSLDEMKQELKARDCVSNPATAQFNVSGICLKPLSAWLTGFIIDSAFILRYQMSEFRLYSDDESNNGLPFKDRCFNGHGVYNDAHYTVV